MDFSGAKKTNWRRSCYLCSFCKVFGSSDYNQLTCNSSITTREIKKHLCPSMAALWLKVLRFIIFLPVVRLWRLWFPLPLSHRGSAVTKQRPHTSADAGSCFLPKYGKFLLDKNRWVVSMICHDSHGTCISLFLKQTAMKASSRHLSCGCCLSPCEELRPQDTCIKHEDLCQSCRITGRLHSASKHKQKAGNYLSPHPPPPMTPWPHDE